MVDAHIQIADNTRPLRDEVRMPIRYRLDT
jgi:hypothetical protein